MAYRTQDKQGVEESFAATLCLFHYHHRHIIQSEGWYQNCLFMSLHNPLFSALSFSFAQVCTPDVLTCLCYYSWFLDVLFFTYAGSCPRALSPVILHASYWASPLTHWSSCLLPWLATTSDGGNKELEWIYCWSVISSFHGDTSVFRGLSS